MSDKMSDFVSTVEGMKKVGHRFAKRKIRFLSTKDRMWVVHLSIAEILNQKSDKDAIHKSELCAWIYYNATNLLDYNKSEKRNPGEAGCQVHMLDEPIKTKDSQTSHYDVLPKRSTNTEASAIAKIQINETIKYLRRMLGEQRVKVWILRTVAGYTRREIAEMLDISISTVGVATREVKDLLGIDNILPYGNSAN